MKALILNGERKGEDRLSKVQALLRIELEKSGYAVETIELRNTDIGPCVGCFDCWLKTPGTCIQKDASSEVNRKAIFSNLIVFLSPVTFGGYSSELKKAFDRMIPTLLPFFKTVAGEVHHFRRYEDENRILCVGVTHSNASVEKAIFSAMFARNALNYQPAGAAQVFIEENCSEKECVAILQGGIHQALKPWDAAKPSVPDVIAKGAEASPANPPKMLLLIGSPRGKHSNSLMLGQALANAMRARGSDVTEMRTFAATRSSDRMDELMRAIETNDLIVLATPLYADSMPATVIATLEQISRMPRQDVAKKKQFAVIVNCGFPEAHHNSVAIAQYAQFAQQVGFSWMGGLAMGMGEAIGREPLEKRKGMLRHVVRGLELTADALSKGQPIPEEAKQLVSKPLMPRWFYIWMGNWGWKRRARKWGTSKELRARPFTFNR